MCEFSASTKLNTLVYSFVEYEVVKLILGIRLRQCSLTNRRIRATKYLHWKDKQKRTAFSYYFLWLALVVLFRLFVAVGCSHFFPQPDLHDQGDCYQFTLALRPKAAEEVQSSFVVVAAAAWVETRNHRRLRIKEEEGHLLDGARSGGAAAVAVVWGLATDR